MIVYVQMNIYCVRLYAMQFNLNHFSFILHILIYLIICVTEIKRVDDLIYNV